jgi:hypothetical protein
LSTYALTYSSKLTEDFIHADSILASATAASPLATFVNANGQSEALVIQDDGELCHLQREPLSSSGWNIFGIGAGVQSIAAVNSGTVWIMDVALSFWQSNAGHWNFVGSPVGGDLTFSVAGDGTLYALATPDGNNFHLFTYDAASASFQDAGVVPIDQAPVGSPGSLWSLTSAGVVMTSTSPGKWMEAPGAFGAGDIPTNISVGLDGSVFVLCAASGAIYSFAAASQSWSKITQAPPGTIDDLSHPFEVLNAQTFYVVVQQGGTAQLACYAGGAWSMVPVPPYGVADISIGIDGSLWCLDPSGTVWRSDSVNWIRQMIPTGLGGSTRWTPVSEVVTGLHSDGNQYAFYVTADGLYWSMLGRNKSWGGVWTNGIQIFSGSSNLAGCSNLSVTYPPLTNNALVVYGVTTAGELLIVQKEGDAWTATQTAVTEQGVKPLSLAGAKIQYAAMDIGVWNLWCVVDNVLYNGTKFGNGLKSPPTNLDPTATPTTPATMIPFATVPTGSLAGFCTAFLDTAGQIWFVTLETTGGNTSTQVSQVSGPGVDSPIGPALSAVTLCSAQPSKYITEARIFARDSDDSLWIIRVTINSQTATAPSYSWSEWHPLGNNCIFLANGPANVPSTDLFTLDEGYEVNVLSEDLTTGIWSDLVMLKPAGTNTDCEYVSRYLTEVSITDENSIPQSNFSLGVTADEPIGIWVGNTLYDVTAGTPVQLATDQTGKITFGFFASDLYTPTFSFNADDLSAPPTICPAQAVNNYLAGQAGALPATPDFDAAGNTLKGAQMQTQPEWVADATAQFVQPQDQANAPGAAAAITQIYTIPLSATGMSGQWQVAPSQTGVGSSSFWSDLCQFGHDIDHAVKKAALKVTKVAVDVANKVVSFTMELANGASQVLQLVIKTARDVVSAVKSVFRYIERGVDEVIHWLKALFKWGDVLNTKIVFETALNGLMAKLAENFNPNSPVYAGTLFKTYFDELVSTIQQAFQNAESVFAPTQTFGGVAGSVTYPDSAKRIGNDALHPTNVSNAQSANGSHTNYVHTHTLNYTTQGGTFPPTAMGDGTSGDGILQALFDAIDQNLNQDPYKTAAMESVNNLQQIFSNPRAFADVIVYDIINAIEKAVMLLLDVIESVVEVLFSLAGNALAGFQALLNKQIDIPVISWIYSKISDHPLTMLDLFCLFIALPATLLYKLTFGLPDATPPFTDESAKALVDEFSDPATFPWPAIASNPAAAARYPQALGSFPFAGAFQLIVFNFGVYAICDGITDLTAYRNFQYPPKGESSDPVATFMSWCNIVTSMASQWLGANYSIFPSQTSAAERMTLANWGLNFIPIASSLVFTIGSSHKALAEFNSAFGLVLTSGIGWLLLAMGVATSVVQATDSNHAFNPLYWAQNVIAPIPTVLKPLVAVPGSAQTAAIACGCLLLADGVFDLANGTLGLVEDMT